MKDLTPQLTDDILKRIEKFEGFSLSEARASPSPTRPDCQHIQVFFTTDAKTFEGARDAASDLIDEMLAMGAEYRGHEIFEHKGAYRAWCEFLFVMYEQEAEEGTMLSKKQIEKVWENSFVPDPIYPEDRVIDSGEARRVFDQAAEVPELKAQLKEAREITNTLLAIVDGQIDFHKNSGALPHPEPFVEMLEKIKQKAGTFLEKTKDLDNG